MLTTRLIPVLILGTLMMSPVFAADKPATATTNLTKDQISAIEKECSKNNSGSMTSPAYKNCVKAKEETAATQPNHKK